jgi:hypothetical protein
LNWHGLEPSHSVEDLRRALKGEEYDNVEGHLSGMAIRKQLKDILEEEAVKRVMPAS